MEVLGLTGLASPRARPPSQGFTLECPGGRGVVMIVLDQDNQLVVIRQTDHGMLAGFLARHWGNAMFRRPEPFGSFCMAAAEHDNGWTEWEMRPEVDPVAFAPYTFVSIPTAEHMELYR